jgi:ubiquitin carboxyl-terminal hydrolase L5
MLNSDLQLKNEATLKRSSGATRQYDDGSSEAGFHFIAFVPVMGSVWKFDGLERQPQSLGKQPIMIVGFFVNKFRGPYSGEDWLKLVRPHLEARMRDYEEDQIEFSVLSVVKDPLCAFVEDLALNVKRLRVIGECLQKFSNNDSLTSQNGGCADDIILGPSPAFQLTQDDIDLASDSDTSGQHTRDYQTYDLEKLTREDASLRADQRALKVSIQDELQSRQADDDYANGRRYDYTSVVSSWARILARKGIVRDFIDKSS